MVASYVYENVLLSPQLRYFRSEDSQESMLLIPVGNVTADTELTYEYGSRTKKNRPSVKGSTDGDGMFIIIMPVGKDLAMHMFRSLTIFMCL